jgi:hypothetical protein
MYNETERIYNEREVGSMKKAVAFLLCIVLLLPLVGCNTRYAEREKKLNYITVGMSFDEVVSLMGEPDADIGSGVYIPMYILSEQRVAVFYYMSKPANGPWVVEEKPTVMTFEAFREKYGYYPNDLRAWWN